jgi:Transposase, Mutator family
MLRISPVYAFKHVAKLRAQYRDRSRHHRGPYETATLQPFGIKRHAKPIMPEDLDQIAGWLQVRRILYTTNAIEALNAKLRSAVRARGHFPTDEAALKLLYLVLNRTEKEWTMPPREWAMAKAQFAVLFGQRFTRAMA